MKDIVFWILLIVILVSIVYVSQFNEGYQDFQIPKTSPPRESLTSGDFTGWTPSSATLLAPPPGGVASVNALPHADPSQEKSPFKRIKEVLETANGFLQNEAPHMVEMSDPSVQLPLTTLKADINRLTSEELVLERNPGIESTLTQHDVDGMEANVVYLQKKWRESVNSTSGIEGFDDASGNTMRASLSELKDLLIRLTVEMSRLSGSATTDPITQARLKSLDQIKAAVQGLVDRVNSKMLKESDIPILESDYRAFLPVLGTNGALPTLFAKNNLPPTLSSLFPTSLGDISGAAIARYLFDNYAQTFFNGLSFEYTSQRSLDIANAKRDFAMAAKSALTGAGLTGALAQGSDYGTAPTTQYRGEFASVNIPSGSGPALAGVVDPTATATATVTDTAARFDWKTRSIAICEAVQKRGYNPGDFGCLADVNTVSANFSWRGYTKMVCSRISTLYDTGAPEACGCPPLTWSGWRL